MNYHTHTKSMWWVEAQGWWWTNFLSRSDMPACHPWTSQWWRKELYKVLRQNRAVHGASGICSSAECAKYDCRGAERVRCVVVLDLLILTRRLLTFLSLDWKRFYSVACIISVAAGCSQRLCFTRTTWRWHYTKILVSFFQTLQIARAPLYHALYRHHLIIWYIAYYVVLPVLEQP